MGFLSVLSFAQSLVKERARPGDLLIDATVGTGVDTLFLARIAGQSGCVFGFDVQEEALRQAARRLQTSGFSVEIAKAGQDESAEHNGLFDRREFASSDTFKASIGANTPSSGGSAYESRPGAEGSRGAGANARGKASRNATAARVMLLHGSHECMAAVLPETVHGKVAAVMFNLGYLPGGDPAVITLPSTTLPALDAALHLLRPGGIITAVLYTGHAGGQAEADAVHRWAESLPRSDAHVICYRPLNHHAQAPYLIAAEKR